MSSTTSSDPTTRYLSASQTRAALRMDAAVDAMRAAFGPDRESPLRTGISPVFFMPGRVADDVAVKIVSSVPGDPAGAVVVFDREGHLLGLVDGATLTAIRTAAAPGLATDLMAASDASVLAMLGAGAMAFDQVEAVRAVRPIERVLLWSRTRQRAEELAERLEGVAVEIVDDPDTAVAQAEVVSTATPSESPLFAPESLRPGVHINAVGAFSPAMAEVPPETVEASFVVVDDRTAAAEEAGDLLQAGREPDADLAEVLAGTAAPNGQPTTLFKSVGIASQDVAAGARALREAAALGIGTALPS